MRKQKISRKRINIRPMRGPVRLSVPEGWGRGGNDAIEFIGGMGYFIYEDPTDGEFVLVTDKQMTYKDFLKSWLSEGSRPWVKRTFGDRLNEELDDYRW